jgi:hypothetical protein
MKQHPGKIMLREREAMSYPRHCEERCDEAIQTVDALAFWIASLRSQ